MTDDDEDEPMGFDDTEKSISITWNIEDVHDIRPDLTPDQAMQVLAQAERKHDANVGINWAVLEAHCQILFPKKPGHRHDSGANQPAR